MGAKKPKSVDLKRRLDADLYRALAVHAAESGQPLEVFIAALLAAQVMDG